MFFAARSGEARGFFLPGIWINVVYGLVFLGSALVGRPLVGAIYAAVEGMGSAWRQDARLRRVFALASVFWALVFGARAVVQGTLYVLDRPGLLAAARLLMGWPLTIARRRPHARRREAGARPGRRGLTPATTGSAAAAARGR